MTSVEIWNGSSMGKSEIIKAAIQDVIDFQHAVHDRVLKETNAAEVFVKFEVTEATKPRTLGLNVFVNFYDKNKQDLYWPWIDVDVNDLIDHTQFLDVIVEKITRELHQLNQ